MTSLCAGHTAFYNLIPMTILQKRYHHPPSLLEARDECWDKATQPRQAEDIQSQSGYAFGTTHSATGLQIQIILHFPAPDLCTLVNCLDLACSGYHKRTVTKQ